ncbi:hypothetical protein [Sinomonas humi]|uniref:Uncharacterized protein n=1 Tax=Sinomonas humi TaxID=1338436 RepID=A0A0B2AL26_9MICC|nr:hypothetical protein LK10_12810 [Sinomonas humi]
MTSPSRKYVWQGDIGTVEGEKPTGFERVCAASDLGSASVNWSERGAQYINADATVSISRLPSGSGIGIAALDWSANGGVSAGAARLFDEMGPFGVVSVSAIAQTRVRVDFTPDGFALRELL